MEIQSRIKSISVDTGSSKEFEADLMSLHAGLQRMESQQIEYQEGINKIEDEKQRLHSKVMTLDEKINQCRCFISSIKEQMAFTENKEPSDQAIDKLLIKMDSIKEEILQLCDEKMKQL